MLVFEKAANISQTQSLVLKAGSKNNGINKDGLWSKPLDIISRSIESTEDCSLQMMKLAVQAGNLS